MSEVKIAQASYISRNQLDATAGPYRRFSRYIHNRRFMRNELTARARFFDTVESYPLDSQQRRAVVADEDNCLVIAGAGSGKSSTIVAKIKYLVRIRHIDPSEILVISFTNKSAADLRDRINDKGIEPRTFHSFGRDVIMKATQQQPSIYGLQASDPDLKTICAELTVEPSYAQSLQTFLKEHWITKPEVLTDAVQTEFIAFCHTFLALFKASSLKLSDLYDRLDQKGIDRPDRLRGLAFITVFAPLFESYQAGLMERNQIDFADMIQKASEYLINGQYPQNFRYIIVDEFQDISQDRYQLLQAVRKCNPSVKIFCVGDDWQSIYKFAGSELGLFENFSKYFGQTLVMRIETTYRFQQPLIRLSSKFILTNPAQLKKDLKAGLDDRRTTYNIFETDAIQADQTEAFMQVLNNFEQLGLSPGSSVFLIGRYNFDFTQLQVSGEHLSKSIPQSQLIYIFSTGAFKGEQLTIHFLTAHKSKGLEADYAIIINCSNGKFGWPSGRSSDPLLGLLRPISKGGDISEERRLFYVAMTRAKRHVTFLVDPDHRSIFIKELQAIDMGRPIVCPKCGNGRIIRQMLQSRMTASCSSPPGSCTYSA